MKITNISVVGLGKLGFPLAVCLASKGFKVIAVDIDPIRVEALNSGQVPFYEPGLKELLHKVREDIKATCDIDVAIIDTEVTFIVVPTPSDEKGNFSVKYVLDTCRGIGLALKKKHKYHLVVVTSTVTPQTMDSEIKPILEHYSGKKCVRDFGLCYNPEFIALGSVIHDLYNPDFLLIGESDSKAGDLLTSIYKFFCDKTTPAARMNFVNAELAKLLVNTFVTMKISYSNMIAHLCEHLPGADVDVVTRALGFDSRIGPKYLKGALGYGGPCFPRDNLALLYTAHHIGTEATLADITNKFNREQIATVADLILSKLPPSGRVGVLGLSYKPNTDVVEESQGMLLAELLNNKNIPVTVYDPASAENAKKLLNGSIDFAASAKKCIEKSSLVIITTPWDEFKEIPPHFFCDAKKCKVVIDCWRILDGSLFKKNIKYIPLGVGLGKIKARKRGR